MSDDVEKQENSTTEVYDIDNPNPVDSFTVTADTDTGLDLDDDTSKDDECCDDNCGCDDSSENSSEDQ